MIDIRTFMLVLAIGNVTFAILMAGYARAATANPAMRVWIWSRVVQGCGHLLFWLRPELPYLSATLAANAFFILGGAAEVAAHCFLFEFPRWKRLLFPLTGLALLALTGAVFAGLTSPHLALLMSVIAGTFYGVMSYILLRPGPDKPFLRRLIGINDLVFFFAMCWRTYTGVAGGTLTVFSSGPVQSFSYVTAYLLMIVNSFGFLLLCKEKDDRQMQRLATTDSLTGLANRQAFLDHTESARMLASRMRQPVSLMMIDIDHFKGLNDRYGHAGGDEALRMFAATAQGALREHDVMGRLGGEEFAVVMPGTDIDGALRAAERLRLAVAEGDLVVSGDSYAMTVSIGVVEIDQQEPVSAALARADRALYRAKSTGRNRVEAAEPLLRVA